MEPVGGGGGAVMAAAASPWRRRPQQHLRPPTSQERPPLPPARRDEDEEEDLVTWFFSSPSHPSETDYTSFHLLGFRQKVRGAADWSGGWVGCGFRAGGGGHLRASVRTEAEEYLCAVRVSLKLARAGPCPLLGADRGEAIELNAIRMLRDGKAWAEERRVGPRTVLVVAAAPMDSGGGPSPRGSLSFTYYFARPLLDDRARIDRIDRGWRQGRAWLGPV